ncbi:MAG: long-chain fatty acid--CoA ligase [Desulfobacteraceae bacterium]|jgi:fatty-acyl-CoA synthase
MIKSMNIAWWVQRWGELHPNKPAIIFEGQEISYLELQQRANRTSRWLQSLGIEKGDRVAAMLENCPQFIELYLACSRLGAIFVPVNFRLAGPELDYTLTNSRPRLFVFAETFAETVLGLELTLRRPLIFLASLGPCSLSNEVLDYNAEVEAFEGQKPFLTKSLGPANPEEPHVIMYTSGTTGQPKGAVLSHRKTFFNCLNADIFFKLHFDDIMLIVLPLFHSGGLFIQASPTLYKGATMIIHPRFDPLRAYEDIQSYQVTKFLGVPTVYKSLVKVESEKRTALSSLKVCAIGGEKATPELMIRFREAGFPLRQIMGQTETSILLWASEEDVIRKPGSVGRPVFHAEVGIVNHEGRPCKPGEVGEIVVRGSIMMKEYWQDPVKTEETIKSGWLHTGDLAKMDEEGYYYLVDRARNMYISGGENVYPAEVERVLRQHPDIEDVAVVGIPDEDWGEVGHAFVICKPGSKLSPEDVISHCDGRLARFKWPKMVTFCKQFPQTALGKVRKALLIHETANKEG